MLIINGHGLKLRDDCYYGIIDITRDDGYYGIMDITRRWSFESRVRATAARSSMPFWVRFTNALATIIKLRRKFCLISILQSIRYKMYMTFKSCCCGMRNHLFRSDG